MSRLRPGSQRPADTPSTSSQNPSPRAPPSVRPSPRQVARPRGDGPPIIRLRDDQPYTDAQLERIENRFYDQAAATGPLDDQLSFRGLSIMPEFHGCPFLPRLFELHDPDGDGWLSVDEFMELVVSLRRTDDLDAKRRLVFSVYDLDGDGWVSPEDLRGAMRLVAGRELSEAQIAAEAARLMAEHDANDDGGLELGEFGAMCAASDLLQKFTVDFI